MKKGQKQRQQERIRLQQQQQYPSLLNLKFNVHAPVFVPGHSYPVNKSHQAGR